ncbi:ribosome recycling factor [Patescibacteria group bacterium]|nr:ribosome recycling factor [Patescibacteria group bacterium]MBU4455191.1 ribosome recycling factor [Patescibacteria group bacterium]MCG2690462.1 ribosome recycling factor [Candidatus Parcubacteria bacterium]
MNKYLQAKQEEFNKAVEFFKKEIAHLRTNRVNPNILDSVQADVYGAKTPLNGLASITVPEARSMVVAPWDKNIIKEVEKAITAADLGLSIVNEGDKLRLIVPLLTEENRREIAKKLSKKLEDARISVRQIRDEIKSDIEQAEKNKEINEDDKFRFIKELDEEVAENNNELKKTRDKKEEEIMTI